MEGCRLVAVDVAEFEEAGGESGCELSSAIGNDIIGETMVLENMLEVEARSLFGVHFGGRGAEMCHFGETVHADKDGVTTSGSR